MSSMRRSRTSCAATPAPETPTSGPHGPRSKPTGCWPKCLPRDARSRAPAPSRAPGQPQCEASLGGISAFEGREPGKQAGRCGTASTPATACRDQPRASPACVRGLCHRIAWADYRNIVGVCRAHRPPCRRAPSILRLAPQVCQWRSQVAAADLRGRRPPAQRREPAH